MASEARTRQDLQKRWPHGVAIGCTMVSMQMPHWNAASSFSEADRGGLAVPLDGALADDSDVVMVE